MNAVPWIAALVAVIAIDFAVAIALLVMSNEENCGNGIDRWQCDGSLQDFLVIVLIALPALYVVAAVLAAGRSWTRGRSA